MWLSDLVDHLEAQGVGTAGVDLFWGRRPEEPTSCGVLIPYAGLAPEHEFGADEVSRELPRAQFSWRADKPDMIEAAFTKAQEAFDVLSSIHVQTIGTTKFYKVAALQSPFLISEEGDDLPLVGFNVQAEFER